MAKMTNARRQEIQQRAYELLNHHKASDIADILVTEFGIYRPHAMRIARGQDLKRRGYAATQLRKISMNVTVITDRQVKYLQALGYGSFTDVMRIAVDRMYTSETARDSEREYLIRATQYEAGCENES